MDNPMESTGPLDPNQAASILSGFLGDDGNLPQVTNEEEKKKTPPQESQEPTDEKEPVEAEEPVEESEEDDPTVTIKIDGKDVEVKLSELKNGYQRQADYTRKTMEVAEQRKAAESEVAKAREERQQYAYGLQQTQALLTAQLQEQSQINWQELLDNDPVEYLKQQHLAQQRQAQLQQVYAEQERVSAIQQAEQQQSYEAYLKQQQDDLLAKLPDWKDETKAKAEKEAIRVYLKENGFADPEVNGVSDHRQVVIARKAMLYDQMIQKAQAAAKKVEPVPQKVVKPSRGEPQTFDKRSSAYQRLSKSGSVDDAAAVFASLI